MIIKGYWKEVTKDNKKFRIYNAVGKDANGKPMYGTISFCKDAFSEISEIEKDYKRNKQDVPKMFQFEVPAERTNVKTKIEYALNDDGSYRVTPEGELISFNHIRIYIDGGVNNFTECNDVFEGIGTTAEGVFGRG